MERGIDNVVELSEEIEKFRKRTAQFIQNSREFYIRKEFEKSGELLWGSLANMINIFSLLYTGKAKTGHQELIELVKQIAHDKKDERLFTAIDKWGQKLHANYYHGFLFEMDFVEIYPEVEYAIEQLEKFLERELAFRLGEKPSLDS